MLSVIYAECHTQARYAECHYAEFRYAECRGASLINQQSLKPEKKLEQIRIPYYFRNFHRTKHLTYDRNKISYRVTSLPLLITALCYRSSLPLLITALPNNALGLFLGELGCSFFGYIPDAYSNNLPLLPSGAADVIKPFFSSSMTPRMNKLVCLSLTRLFSLF